MNLSTIDCKEQSPIYINSAKRSGSTLLRRILNAHSQITFPPTERLFHSVYMHLYSYGNLEKDENMISLINGCLEIPFIKKYWGIEKTAEEIFAGLPEYSFRGVYVSLFMLYMKSEITKHWGAKAQSNVLWIREIYNMFPKARFIFLYRDGRDETLDLVNIHWGPRNLYNACFKWKHYNEAILEAKELLPRKRYHEIYYENLVRDPEGQIARLCEYLSVEYEPAMLNFHRQIDEVYSLDTYKETNKPITDKFVGLYKSLPSKDRELQVTIMGNMLRRLGYEVEDKPREIGFWERKWYIEEDEYGSSLLDGGPQYENDKRAQREERKKIGVWDDEDRIRHFLS